MRGFLPVRGLMRQRKVRRLARQRRVAFGLDAEITDKLIARLDPVFQEEVVGDVVRDEACEGQREMRVRIALVEDAGGRPLRRG